MVVVRVVAVWVDLVVAVVGRGQCFDIGVHLPMDDGHEVLLIPVVVEHRRSNSGRNGNVLFVVVAVQLYESDWSVQPSVVVVVAD